MNRIPGWGWLLILALPLLLYVSWSQLQSGTDRVNMQRYVDNGGQALFVALKPLKDYFDATGELALPDKLTLPAVPPGAGIKSWTLLPNTVLVVTLDTKWSGQPAQLKFVPVVHKAGTVFYECFSNFVSSVANSNCPPGDIVNEADIAPRLAANAKALAERPVINTASGEAVQPGSLVGSVVSVPESMEGLAECGLACVKPQGCANARPIACTKTVHEGYEERLAWVGSDQELRGTDIATRSDAEKICQGTAGPDSKVVTAGEMRAVIQLKAGNEYWVDNQSKSGQNCWSNQ